MIFEKWFTLFVLIVLIFCIPCFQGASVAGNIHTSEKYVWSENTGWINMRTNDADVIVHDNYLSGYAWGENIGWIKLGATNIGPYTNSKNSDWGVNIDSNGYISGFAWGENVGWINFNPAFSGNQVRLNKESGIFDGYAWAENIGYIHFQGTAKSGENYMLASGFFNTPPVAADNTIALDEDKHLFIPLNATDSENDQLFYTIVEYPTHGTVTLNGDIVDYTPLPHYNGLDRFSFKANDGYSDSNIARVVLTIYPVDDRPVAEDLIFQTTENMTCSLSFPYTDIDGDILSPTINKPPKHGNLSQDLIYTPDDWFWGTDRFIYSLSDEFGTSLTATVSITVNRADSYTLAVLSNKGMGEIEVNSTRILLPWHHSFAPDTEISLTAITTPDRIFNQWIYDQTSFEINPLVVTMDRGKTITAHFVPPTKILTLLGYQSVKINGEMYSLPLEKAFYQGDHITLNALPQSLFTAWSGDFNSNQNPIDMTIQSDMTIGVIFKDSKEWALPIVAQTVDLPQSYTDTITIGVSLLSDTQTDQLPEEYGCSLWVYSSDWLKYSQLIQAYSDNKYIWVIGINPHGNIGSPEARTSRLSWAPSQLSDIGAYRMYKGFDQSGEIVIPDMRSESSFDIIGEEAVIKYTIVWSSLDESTVRIHIQPGWNLMSLPVKPLDTTASLLFPDALIYSYESGAYVVANELQIGKGYWIKAATNGYDITGESIHAYTISLDAGWHLVGGLEQSVEQSFDPDCVEAAFGYQNGAYSIVSEFQSGNGYWVKLKTSCDVTGVGPN